MDAKRVAVLGSGRVGQVLSDGFLKHGHEVMRGSRDPGKLAAWKGSAGPKASTGTFAEAARFGGIVVRAVKGTAAETVVELAGIENLSGKTAILDRFGWETEDMGGVEAARAIEPLCVLWCIPGITRNQWRHAFKLLR